MNNRIPVILLGLLVLMAIAWRLISPPPPAAPGPRGSIPNWISLTRIGEMGPSAVNPSGTMWAGAWNEKTKSGDLRSAVWIVDFEKATAAHYLFKDGAYVPSLSWADDKTVRVLKRDAEDPADAKTVKIGYIDAAAGDLTRTVQADKNVWNAIAWQGGSDRFAAEIAGSGKGVVVVISDAGKIAGKQVVLDLPDGSRPRHNAAISADGGAFVCSMSASDIGGDETYFLVNAKDGSAKKIFTAADIPGKVEGLWLSPAGVLIVASERDEFLTLRYDPAAGKVLPLAKGTDVAKMWPGAPQTMDFISYNGGYGYDVATGKTTRIFDLRNLGKSDERWRKEVQDGRLYPRKDGDFTSVSIAAGAVDIRVIKKNGTVGQSLLPRR